MHGSAIKTVAFGNFNAGYLVHYAGFRFERSDDAFANDLVVGASTCQWPAGAKNSSWMLSGSRNTRTEP